MQTTLGINWVTPSGPVSSNIVATGTQIFEGNDVIPPSSTNYEIDCSIPIASELQAFFLMANAAMTVKTNSTSAPDNTITLVANVPYYWISGNGSIPLTAAITKFYVTSTPGGTLQIRSLFNSAPNNT